MRALTVMFLLATTALAQLVCETPHHDFGTKPQYEKLTGSFTIKNAGSEKVFIQSAIFKCFCARGAPKRRNLGPGESTTVDFEFNTSGFEGKVKKPVWIRYGYSPVKVLELSIGGVVYPTWKVDTREVQLGALRAGQFIRRSLDVTVREGNELELEATPGSRHLEVTSKKPLEDGRRGWRLDVTVWVPASASPGPLRETLTLKTNDPRKPSDTVFLIGEVEADLEVRPRRLAFGRLPRTETARKTVKIRSRSGSRFGITEVRGSSLIEVSTDIGRVAAEHEIVVVVPKGLPAGAQRGSILVKTDRADQKLVRIEFSVRVVD